jgi:hypothetical protein
MFSAPSQLSEGTGSRFTPATATVRPPRLAQAAQAAFDMSAPQTSAFSVSRTAAV